MRTLTSAAAVAALEPVAQAAGVLATVGAVVVALAAGYGVECWLLTRSRAVRRG